MSTSQSRPLLLATATVVLLTMSGCATGPAGSPAPTSTTISPDRLLENVRPSPPEGRVIGTGTVIDRAGEVQLCLGAVMESYPPQCQGLPVDGWTWEGVDGSETSGDTTWGTYAVYGKYDGTRYTITDPPIMLALYDTVMPEDPTGGVEGKTSASDLTRIQDDLSDRLGSSALELHAERGYVWVEVVWDDGSIQDAADAEFGDDTVVITSALREID